MKKIAIISRSYYDFINHIKKNVKDVTFQNYDDKYVCVNSIEDLDDNINDVNKAIMLYSAIRLHDFHKIIQKLESKNITIEEYIDER